MNYLAMLEESYDQALVNHLVDSRYEFLAENIFEFTTYDGEISELFGRKALEVCSAINAKSTFEYQKDPENYQWYMIMVNMPFFKDKLEWGTSIRGAWWYLYDLAGDKKFDVGSYGLYDDGEELDILSLGETDWDLFIKAMNIFVVHKQ